MDHLVITSHNFLRDCPTVFHNVCTFYTSTGSHRITVSPLSPYTCYFILLIVVVVMGCEIIYHCVLICISQLISDVEHLITFVLTIYIFSLEKYLPSQCFAHFLIVVFGFLLLLSCGSFLYQDISIYPSLAQRSISL